MADEFELKLRVPTARLRAVDAEVAGRNAAPRLGLAASYWDTPGRALAQVRLALRVRREGRRRVQTLKGAGAEALTRLEHDVPVTGDAPDPARHDGTPAGERLRAALADAPRAPLVLQFEIAVMRRRRLVRTRVGLVELALDSGRITAGDRAVAVCELEIELKQGSPAAVFATARRWIERHGLWIDLRSKAAIGGRLAAGIAAAPAVRSHPLRLVAGTSPDAALRAMLRNALDQVLGNAAELADATGTPEHLHQLRIGLRRLRTALREFGAFSPHVDPAWAAALAGLFGTLGAQRDRDALAAGIGAVLHAAGGPVVESVAAAPDADLAACLRGVPFNRLMLDLMAFAHGVPLPPADGDAPLAEAVARRLRRLHRLVRADAKGFAALDAESQHRVRRRLKRLRYALEFGAGLFRAGAVERHLRALRPAQEALGQLNDLAVARTQLEHRRGEGPSVWFGLGWIAARREAAVAACEVALRRLAKARRPWVVKRSARR